MTAKEIIQKIASGRPDIDPFLIERAMGNDLHARRQLADMATARGGDYLTVSEWHEVSKWGVADDMSRCPDHP